MASGIVKWFDEVKGYGFITPDAGGKDLFVHFSGIAADRGSRDSKRNLEDGQRVTYDVEQNPKGPKAVNVRSA